MPPTVPPASGAYDFVFVAFVDIFLGFGVVTPSSTYYFPFRKVARLSGFRLLASLAPTGALAWSLAVRYLVFEIINTAVAVLFSFAPAPNAVGAVALSHS